MDVFRIEGPVRLSGDVSINGSKNASLPIMAAGILTAGESLLKAVPHLSDISVFSQLLEQLGCKVSRNLKGDLCIDSTVIDNPFGEYEIVRRMRASICILGPLLARCGRAEVSMPRWMRKSATDPSISTCEACRNSALKSILKMDTSSPKHRTAWSEKRYFLVGRSARLYWGRQTC